MVLGGCRWLLDGFGCLWMVWLVMGGCGLFCLVAYFMTNPQFVRK